MLFKQQQLKKTTNVHSLALYILQVARAILGK